MLLQPCQLQAVRSAAALPLGNMCSERPCRVAAGQAQPPVAAVPSRLPGKAPYLQSCLAQSLAWRFDEAHAGGA